MAGGSFAMAVLEDQIRAKSKLFCSGQLSLNDFTAWFVPVCWNIEQWGDDSTIALAHKLDGILAEASSGKWSERQLKEELTRAITPSTEPSIKY